ncbi:Protein phosphatase 2C [Quillaja saponaria]|uniref:protein-serine/threonine phosphatase n=1 Tax=Quillaja saponaria TaxID=32244 RepID=A0AAD7M3Y7_QUISA|nr:Protein phosphatase 2C [Quillaja saponaria]
MENSEDEQLERVDSVLDLDLASTSSGLSSILSSEDFRSTTSSGDISTITNSSGEIPAVLLLDALLPPRVLDLAPSVGIDAEELADAVTVTVKARQKCVGRNNNVARWGFTSVIGRRREMEDAVAVIPGFMSRTCDHVGGCTAPGSRTAGEISPIHFFGVYDGHGGSQVAKFCAKRMHEAIAEEWDRETVDLLPKWLDQLPVVVVLSRCQIITSNCGDSRAILCRGTRTIPLTVDQKPDRQDELLRIERGGGKVINWNGARVLGVLAMSRAIGDRYLRPWIIPVPEVTFMTRSDEDECLILASDGLWDVMTNEEVGEVARRILRRWRRSMSTDETSPAQVIADNLTEIAYGRNSYDNISIIVVDLKSKRKRQQRQ